MSNFKLIEEKIKFWTIIKTNLALKLENKSKKEIELLETNNNKEKPSKIFKFLIKTSKSLYATDFISKISKSKKLRKGQQQIYIHLNSNFKTENDNSNLVISQNNINDFDCNYYIKSNMNNENYINNFNQMFENLETLYIPSKLNICISLIKLWIKKIKNYKLFESNYYFLIIYRIIRIFELSSSETTKKNEELEYLKILSYLYFEENFLKFFNENIKKDWKQFISYIENYLNENKIKVEENINKSINREIILIFLKTIKSKKIIKYEEFLKYLNSNKMIYGEFTQSYSDKILFFLSK